MGDFGDSLEKKEIAFRKLEAHLRDQGDNRDSSRNSIIADNETAWEIGTFDSKDVDNPDLYRDGLIVRTRRDGIATKLNSIAILDRLDKIENRLAAFEKRLGFVIALSIVGIVLVWIRH